MKRFLKWAGISLGVLVILALVVVIPLALRGFMAGRMGFYGRVPMMEGPFLRGGFFGGGLMAIFGLLGLIAVVILVAAGGMAIYRAGARSSGAADASRQGGPTAAQPPLQAAQTPSPSSPVSQPAPMAPAAIQLTCVSCGRALQLDWVSCPYCGQKIEPVG